MLLLNRANKVLRITSISEGGLSGTVTSVPLIFQYTVKANASGIIVAHNHASGNSNPSESITQKIKEAGNLIDIQLLSSLLKEIYTEALLMNRDQLKEYLRILVSIFLSKMHLFKRINGHFETTFLRLSGWIREFGGSLITA